MAVELEKYQDILDELGDHDGQGDHVREVLRASWSEAARVFSPRGLEAYLQGAASLKSLGRGTDLVVSFIQSAPAVAHDIGEDAVSDLLSTAIKMYSKTSAAVISLIFSTSPVAAARLGDLELFRGYLHLLDTMLGQAPRGIRPMLEQLDTLLAQLTLGGLRRWALWGAQAHKTDFDAQQLYFSLQSPESLGVLQKERKGTLFIDVQRRIGMYLRALWARDFYMRPTSGDFELREGYRPYIEGYIMHLPDAYDDFIPPQGERSAPLDETTSHSTRLPKTAAKSLVIPQAGEGSGEGVNHVSGLELYRAAAAHAACHVVYTTTQFDKAGLSALQMELIGLVEDARVEALALKNFPGLKQTWLPLHTVTPSAGDTAGVLMARLARAWIDGDYQDNHPWVMRGRQWFNEQGALLQSPELSRDIGLKLAAELSALNINYSPVNDQVATPYRDDNRYLWEFADLLEAGQVVGGVTMRQVRRTSSLMEMLNTLDVPGAGDDANEIWILPSEFFRDEESASVNQQEGRDPPPQPYHYAEWDYQMQLDRPAWCTVLEKRAPPGDAAIIEEIVVKHKPIISRLKFLIEGMQPQGVQRIRKQEDGDDIDLNAAIRAMIEIRLGEQPDPRIMMRNVRKVRDLSVLLLIDLSASTNDLVQGSESSVLQLAREAAVLLADALDKIGDPFALHGFDSNGRHDIEYFRFKDFDAPYDDKAKARLAGMRGDLSTRMGAAIRHAGSILKRQPSSKKLLLVVTDGEPADNDVRDPQYLRFDAKKSVEELGRNGIATYCLSLDPGADQYVSRIFGAKNYMVVDHVQRLPEKLPMLYMGLTR